MTKHTPGPWTAVRLWPPGTVGFAIRVDGKPHSIAGCGSYEHQHPAGSFTAEEAEANSNLIAAAPELLEACQAILRHSREHNSEYQHRTPDDVIGLAEAAIAKAEGK